MSSEAREGEGLCLCWGSGGKASGLALLLLTTPAAAATLSVGPGQRFAAPSAAAAVAKPGDTVLIAAGTYFDCAVWPQDRLTIAGVPGAVVTLTDKTCAGKGSFVIQGNGVTVRNLGFARIRVPDDNGAGIRAEGRDLTVEDSRFVNTQYGILAASPGGGFLRIVGCDFEQQGTSLAGRTNFAVRATGYDLLHIEKSTFAHARAGGDISAIAGRTELIGNRLADEGGHMQGPMVTVEGGALLLQGNTVDLAPGAADRPGVVLATGDAAAIAVRGNTLHEAPGATVPLLRNWTGLDANAHDNTMPPDTDAVTDAGITWHRMRHAAADLRDGLTDLYHTTRHLVGTVVRRVL
jgi:hypothetical protein